LILPNSLYIPIKSLGHRFTRIFTDFIIADNTVIDANINQQFGNFTDPASSIKYPVANRQLNELNKLNKPNRLYLYCRHASIGYLTKMMDASFP